MRSLLRVAALATVITPLASAHAAPRNWVDRYIAVHGHCAQQPSGPYTTQNPLEKPIEEWTNGDLADLKAALDRCDALPEDQTGVSRMWTGPFYEAQAALVHAQQQRAARQEEMRQAARERAEQAEVTWQRRIAADKEAAAARLAALRRAADQEAEERKATEERTVATAEELKAASKLAEETEARAKAARAEAQARLSVEAAKQRAVQAEAQARDADEQARAERQAADRRFAEAHPEASAPALPQRTVPQETVPAPVSGISSRTPCTQAISAYDASDADAARALDRFIESVMRQADQVHIRRNEGGILDRMSEDGFSSVRATAISYCRQHADNTVLQAAVAMYDGLRGAEVSMGLR